MQLYQIIYNNKQILFSISFQISEEYFEQSESNTNSNTQTSRSNSSTRGKQRKANFEDRLITEDEKKLVLEIIDECMENQDYSLFKDPVDPVALQIPDYFKVIKHPMDLTTLSEEVQQKQLTISDFYKLQALIWENCRTYNGYASHSYFYNTANRCERNFVKSLQKIFEVKMQMYKRLFVKPAQLKAEVGKKVQFSQQHKEGDKLTSSDYENIVKLLLKLPETEMIKIIQRFYGINYSDAEQFELQFNSVDNNQIIKFENAIINKLKDIAEYKAKNKRTYRKHINE